MNYVLQIILVIIIFIVIFVVIKDYKENYQECDPESPSLKGDRGPKGDPGRNSTSEITDDKKLIIDSFIRGLRVDSGNYFLNSQQLGCD